MTNGFIGTIGWIKGHTLASSSTSEDITDSWGPGNIAPHGDILTKMTSNTNNLGTITLYNYAGNVDLKNREVYKIVANLNTTYAGNFRATEVKASNQAHGKIVFKFNKPLAPSNYKYTLGYFVSHSISYTGLPTMLKLTNLQCKAVDLDNQEHLISTLTPENNENTLFVKTGEINYVQNKNFVSIPFKFDEIIYEFDYTYSYRGAFFVTRLQFTGA